MVAIRKSAAAKARILEGLTRLKKITNSQDVQEAISEGVALNAAAFLKWKRVGSATLYRTNIDLSKRLKTEFIRIGRIPSGERLTTKKPKPKKRDEIKILRKKLNELEKLLEARDADVLDLLSLLEVKQNDLDQLRSSAGILE